MELIDYSVAFYDYRIINQTHSLVVHSTNSH
jgi:hypothetical protein